MESNKGFFRGSNHANPFGKILEAMYPLLFRHRTRPGHSGDRFPVFRGEKSLRDLCLWRKKCLDAACMESMMVLENVSKLSEI